MPELPEVETVKEVLKTQIIGKTITKVDVLYEKMILDIPSIEFAEKLEGQTFIDIKRKGKFLIFCMNDFFLISHLRMEGKYFIKPKSEPIVKHEHIIFHLNNDMDLRYHDTRKFGIMAIRYDLNTKPLTDLGPEPWDLTMDYLKEKFNSSKPIKGLLLDQSIISGLGNIYADEVCAFAHIFPETKGSLIDEKKIDCIIDGSKKILNKAIKAGGTTIRSYTSSLGVTGRFQNELIVHSKEKCGFCDRPIVKIRVGGRGTYYCPFCQKDKVVIGLTGGISTGKSTVGNIIKENNYSFIDSDLIVKDLWNSKELTDKVASVFDVVKNGIVDKEKLAKIIFNDIKKREELNSIIHPLVKKEIKRQIDEKTGVIFVDVPLLFESGFDELCDYTICVYVNDDEAILRLMKRNNLNQEDAILRVKSQMPIEKKKKLATFTIDNSFSMEQTRKETLNLVRELIKCQ